MEHNQSYTHTHTARKIGGNMFQWKNSIRKGVKGQFNSGPSTY